MSIEKDILLSETMRQKRIVQVTWLIQAALAAAFYQPILSQDLLNIIIMLIVFCLMFLCRHLAKKGKLALAANTISIILTLMVLIFCALNQGVRDEVLLVFPAIITFAVLTGSERIIFALYTIIVISVMLLGLANETGIYVHIPSGSGLSEAILVVIILTVVTYSIRILGVDITRANSKLKKHQRALEQQVIERTSELEHSLRVLKETQEELIEAEKMASLGRLVASVAHEINTPVGIAVTATSIIQEKSEQFQQKVDDNTVSRKDLTSYLASTNQSVDIIAHNLNRASNLVSEFKQTAVLQTDNKKEHVNLFELINHTTQTLNTEAHGKVTITVEGDQNIFVNQDPDVIRQILTNLYTNSVIHGFNSNQHGKINITITQHNDRISLTYCDDGQGIPDENHEKVFEPFFTTKRGHGGTGLGMHILYNLVTHTLNGQVKLANNSPQGVCVTLIIPIA